MKKSKTNYFFYLSVFLLFLCVFLLGRLASYSSGFSSQKQASQIKEERSQGGEICPSPKPCQCPTPTPAKITLPFADYKNGKLSFYNITCYPQECSGFVKKSFDNIINEQRDALLNSPLFRR